MKTIAFTIALTLVSILGFSQVTKGITITVKVDNIKNDTGHLLLGLHTADTFMKEKGIQRAKSEVKDGKITATFTNVEPGTYAIMALHDANDNSQMDFETNGMPSESYGMSNNPVSFGPPEFSAAKFEVVDK
ncbi:MAG: DUF2141 domain-containing protein, partial [Aquaticitalea sp.]